MIGFAKAFVFLENVPLPPSPGDKNVHLTPSPVDTGGKKLFGFDQGADEFVDAA
jgi:hypothetical protein